VYISAFRHGAWKQFTWVGAPVSVHGFSLMDPLNCSMNMRMSCMSCANRYISNQSIGMSIIGHAQIRSDQIMSVPLERLADKHRSHAISSLHNEFCYNIDQHEDDRINFHSCRLHTRRWLSKGNRTSVGS
jgi:hypothetical protein